MKSFYNTINATGWDLFSANKRATRQEDIVFQVFVEGGKEMTPFEVEEVLTRKGYSYPITSIRRSITNLTKQGRLRKTNIKRVGLYGQVNYTWEVL